MRACRARGDGGGGCPRGGCDRSSPSWARPARSARCGRGAKFFEDHSARLACAIITIRGVGFRAAMVRTIASSVLSLLPRFRVPFPKHIGGSLEDAAAHAYAVAPELSPAALLGAFRALSEMSAAR